MLPRVGLDQVLCLACLPVSQIQSRRPFSASEAEAEKGTRGGGWRMLGLGSGGVAGSGGDPFATPQKLSKNKMNSLDEMKHHSSVLLEKNLQLVEEIKEMDFKTVKEARELLQQYDMFGVRLGLAKCSRAPGAHWFSGLEPACPRGSLSRPSAAPSVLAGNHCKPSGLQPEPSGYGQSRTAGNREDGRGPDGK